MANQRAKSVPVKSVETEMLDVGIEVRIRDQIMKRWTKFGVTIEIGKHRNYKIETDTGRHCLRNRLQVQPRSRYAQSTSQKMAMPHVGVENEERRRTSGRKRNPPIRLGIYQDHAIPGLEGNVIYVMHCTFCKCNK